MAELSNAVRFARANNVQSSLLAIKLKSNDQTQAVIDFLIANTRSLDSVWQPNAVKDGTGIAILLPLMNESQGKAYLQRVSKKLFDEARIDLSTMSELASTKQIKKRDTEESCLNFIHKVTANKKLADKKTSGLKFWEKRKRVA